MKKIQLFAMALAAITIISCSKENPGSNGQPRVVEGIETYATFSFSVEQSSVTPRAASETDKGRTTSQNKVNNIIVTIFKEGSPSQLEAFETFNDKGTTGILTGAPMKLSSGTKRIFVFANAGGLTSFPELVVGKTTLESCYGSTMSPLNTLNPATFSLATLTDANGYFMSNARTASSVKVLLPNISSDASKADGVAADAEALRAGVNNFSFSLQKGVSKVQAHLDKDATRTIAATATAPAATMYNMKYTVKNINNAVRPVQLFTNLYITDAEASTKGVLPLAAGYDDFNLTSAAGMAVLTTYANKYSNANAIDQELKLIIAPTDDAVFVTENTNAKQVYGNTSYLAVEGKYVPSQVLASCMYETINEGKFTPTPGTLAASGDFWKVDLSGLNFLGNLDVNKLKNNLFQDATGATNLLIAVLTANGIKNEGTVADKKIYTDALAARIIKYTGGLSYYRLNLGVTTGTPLITVFGVKRNSIYVVKITKINKLGVNTADGLNNNPETPVTSQETYVTAVITVKPWDTMNQDGEL